MAAILALAVALALAAAVVILLLRQARDRRRFGELLARLDQLEARRQEVDFPVVVPPAGQDSEEPSPTTDDPAFSNLSADVLAGMTTHVKRLVESSGKEAQTLADQAILCVHKYIGESITPHQLAHALHVSLRTLERGLLMTLGCNPRQLILAIKMREARRLLSTGQPRVAEIAERLGFSSPFHFSRRFKDFYHVPPSDMKPDNEARR